MTRRDSAPSPPSTRSAQGNEKSAPNKCPIRNTRSSTINCQCDRNATRDVLPNRYQQSWCCPHLKNKNSCNSLDLQLFMRGEADGIRTRNPRIDSPVIVGFSAIPTANRLDPPDRVTGFLAMLIPTLRQQASVPTANARAGTARPERAFGPRGGETIRPCACPRWSIDFQACG